MEITWDENKNKSNKLKHGISFETAEKVFDDPYHLSKIDHRETKEKRWLTIGQIMGIVIIIVAHTYKESDGEEYVRIISARKATKKEQREYEYER